MKVNRDLDSLLRFEILVPFDMAMTKKRQEDTLLPYIQDASKIYGKTIEQVVAAVRKDVARELELYRDDILASRNIKNPTWIGKHELNKFIEGLKGNITK
jgi:hypothetical protein